MSRLTVEQQRLLNYLDKTLKLLNTELEILTDSGQTDNASYLSRQIAEVLKDKGVLL